jgi:hypothetical protein
MEAWTRVGIRTAIPWLPVSREDMSNVTVPGRVIPHRKPEKERIGNGYALSMLCTLAAVLILGPRGDSDGLHGIVG